MEDRDGVWSRTNLIISTLKDATAVDKENIMITKPTLLTYSPWKVSVWPGSQLMPSLSKLRDRQQSVEPQTWTVT